MPSDTPTAFFSYSREDSEFALRLARDLKKAGAKVWMDKLDIRPGQLWERKVEEALTNSPRMLVILSPSSVNSSNVMAEAAFAIDEGKEVIPVLFRDCKIPFRLRPFQHVDFRADYSEALEELLNSMGAERPPEIPLVSGVPPAPEQKREGPATAEVELDEVTALTRQADTGGAWAMAQLGYIYGAGKGVKENRKQSFLWYRKAAEAGDVNGMFNLALIYSADGELRDEQKAVSWYRKAAEAGEPHAMFKLAFMYEWGRGVERDYTQAIAWYGKAHEGKVAEAADALERVTLLQRESENAAEWQRREQERKEDADKARFQQEEQERQAAAEQARLEEDERARQEQEGKAAAEKARVEQQAAAEQARFAEGERARQEQESKAAAEKARLEQQERERRLAEAEKAQLEQRAREQHVAARERLAEESHPEITTSQILTEALLFPDSVWGKALVIGIIWAVWRLFLGEAWHFFYYSVVWGTASSLLLGFGFGLSLATYLGWTKSRMHRAPWARLAASWAVVWGLMPIVLQPLWHLGLERTSTAWSIRELTSYVVSGALTALLLRKVWPLFSLKQAGGIVLGYAAASIAASLVMSIALKAEHYYTGIFVATLISGFVGSGVMFWQLSTMGLDDPPRAQDGSVLGLQI